MAKNSQKLIITGIGVLLLTITGIYFFSTAEFSSTGEDHAAGQQEVHSADTTGSSRSNASDSTQDGPPKNYAMDQRLAPGTILLEISIDSVVHSAETIQHIKATVREVIKYGSSTPALPAGTTLSINTATFFNSDGSRKSEITPGSVHPVVVKHEERIGPGAGNQDPHSWRLIEINH